MGRTGNKPATWVVNCRIGGQGPLLHVGHGGHQQTIAGVLARLRLGSAALPLGGHARVVQEAEEIAFADPMAFCPCSWLPNGFQGLPLAAQLAGTVADGVAFWATAGRWVGLGRKVGRGWGAGRSRALTSGIDSTRR